MAERKMKIMAGECRQPLSPISAARASSRTPSRTKCDSAKKTCVKTENFSYDRFIPNRAMMDNDASHYHVISKEDKDIDDFTDKMKDNLQIQEARILQMKLKAPQNREGEVSGKMLYTSSKPTPAKVQDNRYIPSAAEKILDAPSVNNDYYLNLLDWGSNDVIVIALHDAVFLWNNSTGSVVDLFNQASQYSPLQDDTVITSVKWITEGSHLAIGLSNGVVQLWDTDVIKRVRSMPGHTLRVGTLDWNNHLLTSGSKSGRIHNHDVRIADHHISTFASHTQEVCGMDWAPNGHHLATGGNDNILNVWDLRSVNEVSTAQVPVDIDRPLISVAEHTSAVKAVAWCPWQCNLLASGGGNADQHIKFWNTSRGQGTCLKSVDTMAQVSNVLWSGTYKEVICSHGKNMSIWQYHDMHLQRELTGHTERILSMAMSPNSQNVATVGADETLRYWKCFEPPIKKKAARPAKKDSSSHSLISTIR